ncbi:thymidine kinase [Tunicatimonas pelagia]|uniref:thymidine kinase n=1 Tax=Tunicatimonas pelagia TaxID=931531 RepID=UPI002664E91A|nr:thymidine kinase [Tunicatimonas pelagia]WKN44487.1 thymidine kinase [Tunicatimonas pelagia]
MFTEPQVGGLPLGQPYTGWIEVICGCMFSGKTEELIRRLNRAIIAQQPVRIFKPVLDNRYDKDHVVSHNQTSIPSVSVNCAQDILSQVEGYQVIGIDEAQFFDEEIVGVCNELANQGKRVIVAGLDMDYEGKPFGAMPNLLAIAEYVTKTHAICAVSGAAASFSYRLDNSPDQIQVGARDQYEARSRYYFYQGQHKKEHTKDEEDTSAR